MFYVIKLNESEYMKVDKSYQLSNAVREAPSNKPCLEENDKQWLPEKQRKFNKEIALKRDVGSCSELVSKMKEDTRAVLAIKEECQPGTPERRHLDTDRENLYHVFQELLSKVKEDTRAVLAIKEECQPGTPELRHLDTDRENLDHVFQHGELGRQVYGIPSKILIATTSKEALVLTGKVILQTSSYKRNILNKVCKSLNKCLSLPSSTRTEPMQINKVREKVRIKVHNTSLNDEILSFNRSVSRYIFSQMEGFLPRAFEMHVAHTTYGFVTDVSALRELQTCLRSFVVDVGQLPVFHDLDFNGEFQLAGELYSHLFSIAEILPIMIFEQLTKFEPVQDLVGMLVTQSGVKDTAILVAALALALLENGVVLPENPLIAQAVLNRHMTSGKKGDPQDKEYSIPAGHFRDGYKCREGRGSTFGMVVGGPSGTSFIGEDETDLGENIVDNSTHITKEAKCFEKKVITKEMKLVSKNSEYKSSVAATLEHLSSKLRDLEDRLWSWRERFVDMTFGSICVFLNQESASILLKHDTRYGENICHALVHCFNTPELDHALEKVHLRNLTVHLCHSTDKYSNLPLHAAVQNYKLKAVELLANMSPLTVTICNGAGFTPIKLAFDSQQTACLRILLGVAIKNDGKGQLCEDILQPLLIEGIKCGYFDILEVLSELKNISIDWNCVDSDNNTAWYYLLDHPYEVVQEIVNTLVNCSLALENLIVYSSSMISLHNVWYEVSTYESDYVETVDSPSEQRKKRYIKRSKFARPSYKPSNSGASNCNTSEDGFIKPIGSGSQSSESENEIKKKKVHLSGRQKSARERVNKRFQETRFNSATQTESQTSYESDDEITSLQISSAPEKTYVVPGPVGLESVHIRKEVEAEHADDPETQNRDKKLLTLKHLDDPLTQVHMNRDSIIESTSTTTQVECVPVEVINDACSKPGMVMCRVGCQYAKDNTCRCSNTNNNFQSAMYRKYKTSYHFNMIDDTYHFSFDHYPILELVAAEVLKQIKPTDISSFFIQSTTEMMIAHSLHRNVYDCRALVLSWPTLLSPVLRNTMRDFIQSLGFIAFKASMPTSLHYLFGMCRPVVPSSGTYKVSEPVYEIFRLIVAAMRRVRRCIPQDVRENIDFTANLLNENYRQPSRYAQLWALMRGETKRRKKMKAKEEKGTPLQVALMEHEPSDAAAVAALTFTNTSHPLKVITSHFKTFSKCCPRHDVQNVLTIVSTCPASAAFGPKRRYCSINDLKDDTKHAQFNASAGYSESKNLITFPSQHVMSDRSMVVAVTRDKKAEPVAESITPLQQQLITREPLATLQPAPEASAKHRRMRQQVPQSDFRIGVLSPDEAQQSPQPTAQVEKHRSGHRLGDSALSTDTTQREELNQSRNVASRAPNDVRNPSVHTRISGHELEEYKDTTKSLAELLHAQDYGRILPLAYEGHPPTYLPLDMRIPYIFVTGLAYYKMSNHKKSVQYFQQCQRLAEECGRDGDVTICNIYMGDIDFAQRNYTEAAGRYQTALHYYSRDSVAKDFRMILPTKSAVWAKCGSAFKNASRVGDAVAAYERAIEVSSSKKDKLSAHTSLGNLFQGIGENERAVKEYESAIDLATELGDDVSLGWNHGNLGNALLGLHLRDKALHHLFKALDMAVDYETTPQAIGRAYNNLGTAYQSLNELDKAEEYYDFALAQAIYGNDISGQARVYGNIGNLQMLNKQYDRAVPHYTEVMRLSQDKATITTAHHNRGCAYYDWAEKKKKNAVTLRSSPKSSSRFKISLHGPEFERCKDKYRPLRVPESVQKYYLQGTRDLEYVIKHHEENLHGIQGSPKGLSLSVSLFETNSRTFHRMQDCLIHLQKAECRRSRFEDSLLVAEQSRARTLGELLLKRRGPQLQHQLQSPPTLDQLNIIVSRQSSPVVYLSYTGERVLGWLLYPTSPSECSLNMFEVPLSDNEFDGKSFDYHLRYSLNEQLVERSFEMYKPFDDSDKSKTEPVEKLYDLVGKPVMAMLKELDKQHQEKDDTKESRKDKVRKIVIVPDSYTNLLPFTCVLNRKTGKFWGDSFYFQIMPSLLTMGILDQLPAVSVAIPVQHQQMLCVVGNPTIPPFKYNNDQWDLGKLPHATKEAEWVSHILKCNPILHEQATKDAVMMRIMNAKVIHLATHGSAVAGFLAFAGMSASSTEVVDAKKVLIYPEEIESLNISPALVVLSSCDSGRGVFKADGIQGMARAFILAGAQAVLTTLWRVPDESACIFMQFFYQYLVDGMKGTEALHKAILCLRCFSKYSQYIHWSGYQLTGREFQFDVSVSSARAELTTRLGQSSVFPRLDILKGLETAFMNNPRLPTDVQVLHGPPGVKPSEPLVDFIHCHHLHFTGGIFWINCRTPQLIDASFSHIKTALGLKELTDIPDIETQPSLVVLDLLDKIPKDDTQLLTFLKRSSLHIVIISKSANATDALQKAIDHELIRGTSVIDIQPLSTIHSTQKLVHSALKNHHLAPSRKEQEVFGKLAEFTTGSPPILDLTSALLDHTLKQSDCSTEEALDDFAEQVQLMNLPQLKPSSFPRDSVCQPQEQFAHIACRDISREVYETIKTKDEDVFITSAEYDSWQVVTVLIRHCSLTPEEQLLLYCLSSFNCCPIPTSYVTELATIITKASHQPHLASSLHNKLASNELLKVYPKPAVYHPKLAPSDDDNGHFVYVPRFISAAVWKDMMCDVDKVMALSTCFKAFSKAQPLPQSLEAYFYVGLGSVLVESYELHFRLVGKRCFQEVYTAFLSSHQTIMHTQN